MLCSGGSQPVGKTPKEGHMNILSGLRDFTNDCFLYFAYDQHKSTNLFEDIPYFGTKNGNVFIWIVTCQVTPKAHLRTTVV